MNKLFMLLLLATSIVFSQQNNTVSTYKYGHNGMELIVKSKSKTIIVSTFNSKKNIKDEIAQKVYESFMKNEFINNQSITISGDNAVVSGTCKITNKGKTTAISFYYEKIEWNSGEIEIYKS